jgi:hypothetical protein
MAILVTEMSPSRAARRRRRETVGAHGGQDLGHVEPRLGDGDGRPDVEPARDLAREDLADEMTPGIEGHDLARLAPLRDAGR